MANGSPFVGSLLHLRTLQAFQGLSSRHLATLAQEVEEVILERGLPLLAPDAPAQETFVIVDGRVSVGRGGTERALGPGDAVGFLELLGQGPSGSEARALEDTLALKLDGDGLREVCERQFSILDTLLINVAHQVIQSPDALRAAVQGDAAAWSHPLPGPLDRVGRLLALHRSPAFPSASMDALVELSGHLTEVHLEAGEPLWQLGDPARWFLLLCQGSVRYRNPNAGWTVDVGPGGVPGMPTTLARGSRTVEATATAPVVALRVETEPFLDVLEDHFEMAFSFLGRLARCVLGAQR